MKQFSVTGYVVSLLLLSVIILSPVKALEQAIETIPTNFLQDSPLQIVGYSWRLRVPDKAFDANTNPRILEYIHFYNNSDDAIDLKDWQVILQDMTVNPAISVPVNLMSELRGRLEPRKHVIASYNEAVTGATYQLSGETIIPLLATSSTYKAKIILHNTTTNSGYRDVEYGLKLDSTNSGPTYWQRSFSTTGEGYTSTFTASVALPTQLFDDGLYETPSKPSVELSEVYAYSSNCAPEDTSPLCGDYIKFKLNGSLKNIEDYVVRTDNSSSSRTTSNTFSLANAQENGDFLTIQQDDSGKPLSLTNAGGYIWVEDKYEGIRYGDSVPYPSFSSEHQAWSWMLDSDTVWKWTNTPQPGLPNKLSVPPPPVEVIATCPEGKYLNPDTNRCRTVEEAVNALAACSEGQERNPVTNRCRSIVSATTELTPCDEGQERNPATNRCRSKVLAAATLVPCGEGQERNPATNRCRSIASAVAELLPCDEGYERNPATNRCRKVLAAVTASGAAPATVVEEAKGAGWNTWTWALVAVGATGAIGYGVYEWRHELGIFGRKVASRFGKK